MDECVVKCLEITPCFGGMVMTIAVDGVFRLLHLLQTLALIKHEEERGCLQDGRLRQAHFCPVGLILIQ